jgi:predicted KAP-like P-loop ATPase
MPLWPDNPTSEDLLGFSDVASPIVEALKRDRLDPVALGVFGDWGSGKTTVLELVKDQLKDDNSIVVVYTRPWEYDPATDPKATLIGEVLIAVRDAAGDAAKDTP